MLINIKVVIDVSLHLGLYKQSYLDLASNLSFTRPFSGLTHETF